jgi:hypothetical protein
MTLLNDQLNKILLIPRWTHLNLSTKSMSSMHVVEASSFQINLVLQNLARKSWDMHTCQHILTLDSHITNSQITPRATLLSNKIVGEMSEHPNSILFHIFIISLNSMVSPRNPYFPYLESHLLDTTKTLPFNWWIEMNSSPKRSPFA